MNNNAIPQDGASAFGWRSAWTEIEEPVEIAGAKRYELPTERGLFGGQARHIHPGDRFWNDEERYMIEVSAVKTKIYRGVVGGHGKEGGDSVFYTTDHNPQRRRMHGNTHNPYLDAEPFCLPVETFAEMLETNVLIPHRGNGLPTPP